MPELIKDDEFALISRYITEICGIVIPPEKYYLIETRLFKLILDYGVESFDEFYRKVIQPGNIQSGNTDVNQKIINAITVNETFWFRDAVLWKGFEREILPGLIEKLVSGNKTRIRIWSAAASTGQEAYSIAMCIDNYLKRNNITRIKLSHFEIFATDISTRVLEIAQNGRYDNISMTRGMNDHYKAAYFKNNGTSWDLDTYIKNTVKFDNFNLLDSYTGFGIFDVIFCRYVLIYFPEFVKMGIISRMFDSLAAGGVLFTGNYVLYDLLRKKFDVNNYENLTYYTKSSSATKLI